MLFEFDAREKGDLDRAEGLGYGYREAQLEVLHGHKPTLAFAYLADPRYIDDSLRPYTWYKEFVVSGAMEHRLPKEYLERLQAQEASKDPKPEREKAERAKVAP